MALLSQADLAAVYAAFVADLSASAGETIATVRPDLKSAIAAVDGWVDANAAAFNSAIPLPARTQLTARQKARVLMAVVRRRFEVS